MGQRVAGKSLTARDEEESDRPGEDRGDAGGDKGGVRASI
jgi:hypothetical protein